MVNIIDGRKEKKFDDSTKVLIDIFRATTTLPLMLYRGAEFIIPVRTVTETRRMKAKNVFGLVDETYFQFIISRIHLKVDNVHLEGMR